MFSGGEGLFKDSRKFSALACNGRNGESVKEKRHLSQRGYMTLNQVFTELRNLQVFTELRNLQLQE